MATHIQAGTTKEKTRKNRLVGVVTSDKGEKTVVVSVSRTTRHPLYHKTIRHMKKYKAHNELGAKIGETVMVEETRPLSKDKHFTVAAILEAAKLAKPVEEEKSDLELLLEHASNDEPKKEASKEET